MTSEISSKTISAEPSKMFTHRNVNNNNIRAFTYWKGKKSGQKHYTGFLLIDIDHSGSFNSGVPTAILVEFGKDVNQNQIRIPLSSFEDLVRKNLFIAFVPTVG